MASEQRPTQSQARNVSADAGPEVHGMRKNGKQWHAPKKAFRPGSGLASFHKRAEHRDLLNMVKTKEKEMKDDKRAEHERRVKIIKDRRAAKVEKERYEKLAEKMHRKRVERLKRREKRNKALNS